MMMPFQWLHTWPKPSCQCLLFAILIVLGSCKSSQKLAKKTPSAPLSYEALMAAMRQHIPDYHTVSFKAKIAVKEKRTRHFTMQTRMVRDSIIWASFTGSLGVEGARLLLTRDSILLLDKLNKIYYPRAFSFIETYVPFSVSLEQLQDLLLGIHRPYNAYLKALEKKETYVLIEQSSYLSTHYYLDAETATPLFVHMHERASGRQLQVHYNDYRPLDPVYHQHKLFSFQREVDIKDKKKTKITLRFLNVTFDEPLTFPFSVGDKYEIR